MRKCKITKILEEEIYLQDEDGNNYRLFSKHECNCCEEHYLSASYIGLKEVEELQFDISSPESLFERVDGYGIRLKPLSNVHPIFIPGYGYNNGYYSTDLDLVLEDWNGKVVWSCDISECQDIKG